MDIAALNADCRSGCIEVFIFKLSNSASVECVGIFSSESGHIEFHHTASDFLVRSEADLYISVLEFRMFHDILYGIHDLSYAGLVVGSKKCRAVCSDECLTLILEHFRKFGRLETQSRHSLEGDFATVIILYDLRLHIIARCIGGSVNMGDKTYRRGCCVAIGGYACHYISIFIQCGLHSHCKELVAEHLQKVQLFCGTWLRV